MMAQRRHAWAKHDPHSQSDSDSVREEVLIVLRGDRCHEQTKNVQRPSGEDEWFEVSCIEEGTGEAA